MVRSPGAGCVPTLGGRRRGRGVRLHFRRAPGGAGPRRPIPGCPRRGDQGRVRAPRPQPVGRRRGPAGHVVDVVAALEQSIQAALGRRSSRQVIGRRPSSSERADQPGCGVRAPPRGPLPAGTRCPTCCGRGFVARSTRDGAGPLERPCVKSLRPGARMRSGRRTTTPVANPHRATVPAARRGWCIRRPLTASVSCPGPGCKAGVSAPGGRAAGWSACRESDHHQRGWCGMSR